ncbi:hypothetical protein U9M48_022826 [Paspalum notatum var. saurae]|uniref:Uncharacterized protein n=1 Tax=Paspalum notatum var. saurae TaxID=547442 RepID=A0AAQ3WV93_PASNO
MLMACTAANQQQPLVLTYSMEGLLVYSARLESVSAVEHSDEPPALEIRLSPDPIARFLNDDNVSAIAVVSGDTILSLVPNSRDTAILDIVTQASVPGPQLRDPKFYPVMLPVGDDTVIVMDTVLRGGGGSCCFEALRRDPTGSWRADPLPNPPSVADAEHLSTEEEEDDDDDDDCHVGLPAVSAYFVLGARVWISIIGCDIGTCTYSLDTECGTWRKEGSWAVPLRGQSLYVPELDLVFGFSNLPLVGCSNYNKRCHHLCALDVEARPPVVRHMWEFSAETKEEVPARETVRLAHLGNGRFCIARPVNVERSAWVSAWCNGKGTCFTLVDVTRYPGLDGELELARRGKPHTHQWGWPYDQDGHVDFL